MQPSPKDKATGTARQSLVYKASRCCLFLPSKDCLGGSGVYYYKMYDKKRHEKSPYLTTPFPFPFFIFYFLPFVNYRDTSLIAGS